METEKKENIWRRKIFCFEENKTEKEKTGKKIFGEGKYFFAEETQKEKEKDENLSAKENVMMGGQTDKQTDIVKLVLEF